MCGICGYISKRKIGDDALEAMNDTMYHRGPNDSGIFDLLKEDYQLWIYLYWGTNQCFQKPMSM